MKKLLLLSAVLMTTIVLRAQEINSESKAETTYPTWSVSANAGTTFTIGLSGGFMNTYGIEGAYQWNPKYSLRLKYANMSTYSSALVFDSGSSQMAEYAIRLQADQLMLGFYRNLNSTSGNNRFSLGINVGYTLYREISIKEYSSSCNMFTAGFGFQYEYLFSNNFSAFTQFNANYLQGTQYRGKVNYERGYPESAIQIGLNLGIRYNF